MRPPGPARCIALNGSGRAPAAATIDWYEKPADQGAGEHLGACVTVPGAVNAWETLLKAHGRKGLDELLQPAIRYRRGRLAGAPEGRRGTGSAWRAKLRKNARSHSCRTVRHRKPVTSSRNPRIGRNVARRRTSWRQGLLRRAGRGRHRSDAARARRPAHRRRLGQRPHNAEFVEPITLNWQGLRRVSVSAKRSGHASR